MFQQPQKFLSHIILEIAEKENMLDLTTLAIRNKSTKKSLVDIFVNELKKTPEEHKLIIVKNGKTLNEYENLEEAVFEILKRYEKQI